MKIGVSGRKKKGDKMGALMVGGLAMAGKKKIAK